MSHKTLIILVSSSLKPENLPDPERLDGPFDSIHIAYDPFSYPGKMIKHINQWVAPVKLYQEQEVLINPLDQIVEWIRYAKQKDQETLIIAAKNFRRSKITDTLLAEFQAIGFFV